MAPPAMRIPDGTYTGALFRPKGVPFPVDERIAIGDGFLETKAIQSGWKQLTWVSPKPLMRESFPETAEYRYALLYRQGGGQGFLLVGSHMRLVQLLLQRLRLAAVVSQPSVRVPALVEELCQHPSFYSLSAAYTRVEGHGQALKRIALFGQDLGEASLFRSLLPQMSPYRVTLREVARRSDIISVNFRGDISFEFRGLQTLKQVDSALRFLTEKQCLDWNAPSAGRSFVQQDEDTWHDFESDE